jgi:hypothetical protein
MKKNLLALSVIGLSFIPYAIVQAFPSYLSFADHQTITKTALSAPNTYCFSTTDCFSFSANAVEQINQVHQVVDDPSNYNASSHFDSKSFSASVNQIAKNRDQFNRLVNGSSPAGAFIPSNPAFPRMQIQAWQLLGYMLHAAEDFYAHSKWVDEGNTLPLPTGFGALTENTATPTIPPIFSKTLQGTYCPAPAGFPEIVPGISHDVVCPGSPANTLNLHQIAFVLAEQEAQAFVQSIVTDLVTANNAAGFCALLGVPSGTPMCNACSPVEGASSCAAVLYTPGFYNPGELGAPVPVVGTQTVNGTTTQDSAAFVMVVYQRERYMHPWDNGLSRARFSGLSVCNVDHKFVPASAQSTSARRSNDQPKVTTPRLWPATAADRLTPRAGTSFST